MSLAEAIRFAFQALASNKIRTLLTALGLVIGNASVILVVTISLTSREYILEQISGVGSNLITAYFDAGNREASTVAGDYVKMADVDAVKATFGPRIRAATGVMSDFTAIVLEGRLRDIKVIGSDDEYARVRNLITVAGRPMDASDVQLRQRVAVLTEYLATRLYGSQSASIGHTLKLYCLQFSVFGSF